MKKLICLIFMLLIFISVTACVPETVIPVNTIKSNQSGLTLEFPLEWSTMNHYDYSTIEMCFMEKDYYVMVSEIPVSYFDEDLSMVDLINLIKDGLIAETGEIVGEPSYVKNEILQGVVAQEIEMAAVFDELGGLYIKYYIVCFKYNDIFYQIYCWSTNLMYDEGKIVFDKIINSISFSE